MTSVTTDLRRSAAELKALVTQAQQVCADWSADDVAAWTAQHFAGRVAVACSMAGDTVVPHLIAAHLPGVDVLFLQTGYHFAETIETRDALARAAAVTIVDVLPTLSVAEQDAQYGARLHERDPSLCCQLRKVDPINATLAGYEAWVTGVRREDNVLRAHTPLIEWDEAHQLVKINPIAAWSFDELLDYAVTHQVPVNPLLTQGYPSIGCAPCTRAVAPGEDPRAGRWAGLAKTECGLHNSSDQTITPVETTFVSALQNVSLSPSEPVVERAETPLAEVSTSSTSEGGSARGRRLSQLKELESEAIHIIREAVSELERPVLLFSGGKDSVVMLHLAAKAFWPAPVPFPLLHVDTGHNFPEVLAYRDAEVERRGVRLIVTKVQDYIDDGRLLERADGTRNPLQTQPLLDAIAEGRFDAVFGGGRRDEEKARAKERVVSLRDEFGQWDPRNQRPELWNLYNPRHRPGEHVRVFPLSNWTELDVWRYIEAEAIELPELYYAHQRAVFERDGMLLAVGEYSQPKPSEQIVTRTVRYRTVGDMSCTGAVESDAAGVADVLAEVAATRITERGATRADDRLTEAAMEDRKKEGYF
ncbi:MAG: sulfate adenylyltransferase subunit CysD [Micropruina sp.]|nr:sulfate adenylyltransferase subunit CysD [Micropruina sp.]